jgi:hypothetical protein
MTAQVSEEEGPFDSINRTRALLESVLKPIDIGGGLAEASMNVGAVVGGDELARAALVVSVVASVCSDPAPACRRARPKSCEFSKAASGGLKGDTKHHLECNCCELENR